MRSKECGFFRTGADASTDAVTRNGATAMFDAALTGDLDEYSIFAASEIGIPESGF